MKSLSARDRVTRGAAFLDERYPGWEKHIDPFILNINNCFNCILGQLYFGFNDGMGLLHISESDCEFYGFFSANTLAYDDLREAWLNEIASRQLQPELQVISESK